MRIVFMGTPDFAVPSLKGLWESGHAIVGVVTAPDKPAGRGQKVRESPVKQCAHKLGIPVLQPQNLQSGTFIKELEGLKPDLQVVVAFRKLPKAVWALPPYGTINLHASLLPDYRGAAPINWAIINGEQTTGVTTFFLQDKIDAGEIIDQEKVPIGPDETAGTLHDRLMEAGKGLVVKTVNAIASGQASPQPQPAVNEVKKAPKIFKEDCMIHWEQDLDELYNFIRGLSPYPGAWTTLNGKQLKLLKAEKEPASHEYKPGTVLTDHKNHIKVAVPGGYLNLHQLQLEGKKPMAVKDFLNGVAVEEGTVLGN